MNPNELNFGQIVGNEPVTREARILCNLSNHPLEVTGHEFSEPELAKFFAVEIRPLAHEELPQDGPRFSGASVKVTAKPGLPPGRFQPRILLKTNLSSMPEVDLPLFGSIGKDVSVAGSGWDDDIGVLTIGPVKAGTAVQRQLLLFAHGGDFAECPLQRGPRGAGLLEGDARGNDGHGRRKACQDPVDYRGPSAEHTASYMDAGTDGTLVGGKAGQIE